MTTYARRAYNKLGLSSELNASFADRHGSQSVQTHFKPAAIPLCKQPCNQPCYRSAAQKYKSQAGQRTLQVR